MSRLPVPHRTTRRWACVVGAAALAVPALAATSSGAAPAPGTCQTTAFVTSAGEDKVVTIDVPTGVRNPSDIPMGQNSLTNEVAITPDGKTALLVLSGRNVVAVVDVATRTKTGEIPVGTNPQDVAITPDGTTALVTNNSDGTVSTITIATLTKDPVDIAVGQGAQQVAINQAGTLAAVTNAVDGTVSIITIATRTKDPADIAVGDGPSGIAFTPDGSTLFVANQDGDPLPDPTRTGEVSTIDVATRTANPTPISGFEHPNDVVITPDGKTAFVTNFGNDYLSTIDVATRTKAPTDLPAGLHPVALAITPDGRTVYAANLDTGDVTQVDVPTLVATTDIGVGGGPAGIAFTPCLIPVPASTTTTTSTTSTSTTTTTVASTPSPAAQPVAASPRFAG